MNVQCKVVGLTGGIGSGKSSVASYLKENCGVRSIDTDLICRQLLEPQAKGWLALREAYGDNYFNEDCTVNRPLLRAEIFNNQELRLEVNDLLHPLAREEVKRERQKLRATGMALRLVVEVPLLYEAQWENDFDEIVVVYADYDKCCERLMRRDAVTKQAAEKALAAQMPLSEKVTRADRVIDNNGPWWSTCLQVTHLAKLLWK